MENVHRQESKLDGKKGPVDMKEMIKASSAFSRTRTRSGYAETLEKLRKEFYDRWEKNNPSPTDGLNQFDRLKTLGTGSFGRVFLVQHQQTKGYYAMKVIDKIRIVKLKQVEHTLYEKKILESARFPFLISLEFSFKDNSFIYLLMPFINGGEMFTHLRKAHKFDESLSKFYGAQVLLALEFLHYCDVIYRDLKPENILIDMKGYLKIADMGFCKVYEKIISCKYKTPAFFTLELSDLIRNMLQVDLSRRYSHRWFHHTNFEGIFNRQIEPPFRPKIKSASDTSNFDDYPHSDLKISEHNLFQDQFEEF
ncbi:hypothetical protein HUJ04_005464 [Dendroctonus ponderosae]|nr:hypothetical protein HUJ04_005464 [Dendroctonus ponderosae]